MAPNGMRRLSALFLSSPAHALPPLFFPDYRYQWVCLGLVGVLMVAQQGFRNYGFALSRDSSVVTVLYSEIVFR